MCFKMFRWDHRLLHCTNNLICALFILYCNINMYAICTVLYCTVLYCTVLYCTGIRDFDMTCVWGGKNIKKCQSYRQEHHNPFFFVWRSTIMYDSL